MIVVGVDCSEDSRTALRWAVEAGRAAAQPVTVVHAGPPVYDLVADSEPAVRRRAALRPDIEHFVAETGVEAAVEVVDGPPAEALIRCSETAELVVVGRCGKGALARMLIGSTSRDVVRGAHCPVAVVPRGTVDMAPRRVVVGTDGSAAADVAVRWATREAVRRGVPLVLVHAAPPALSTAAAPLVGALATYQDPDAAKAFVTDAVAKAQSEAGAAVTVRGELSWLSAEHALLTATSPADLLVAGSRGLGGVARALLGSTSSRLVELSTCPVVIVPAED